MQKVNLAPALSETAISLDRFIRDYRPPHLIPKATAQISALIVYASSEIAEPRLRIKGYTTKHRSAPDAGAFRDVSNSDLRLEQKHQLLSVANQ
jgi:hypothetical protein